ncbi:signal peptidase II [Stigmatella aurantiaca]|uniref:Lipoprotein signal peptidase n=1 Tax=Stigmatella aurantiaca (strain DW4/3-1) TaxID=378806 RepID=Q099Q4_STIAD|nr:signal peptidase II [Stigmatella aurantiaca]ADO75869.1 Signal peptidase II [Stigmatella aurantiaca DW4/3-1]EAU68431.1 signal peptidase II [Stigmatella aurantiaca DW4/3-1]
MPRKYLILLVVTLVLIALDQWTKFAVVGELTTRFDGLETSGERLKAMYGEPPPLGMDGRHFRSKRSIDVSESFLRLRYEENPGAAWGMFRSLPPSTRGPLFHVVSIGAVLLIGYYFTKLSGTDPAEKWALWGLSLVLGGALGNYIDRIARGFVVDFIQAHWMDKAYWPSFNVADMAICVGVGLLILDAFVRKEHPAATART